MKGSKNDDNSNSNNTTNFRCKKYISIGPPFLPMDEAINVNKRTNNNYAKQNFSSKLKPMDFPPQPRYLHHARQTLFPRRPSFYVNNHHHRCNSDPFFMNQHGQGKCAKNNSFYIQQQRFDNTTYILQCCPLLNISLLIRSMSKQLSYGSPLTILEHVQIKGFVRICSSQFLVCICKT